jgi:hypothetical protein
MQPPASPGGDPEQPESTAQGHGQFPPSDLPPAPPAYPTPPGPAQYAQYPPYYQRPYPGRTNGFAVASLVLGILGFFVITGILALIFGYVAREQIRERGESGDGMAIAGIVLGWVWLGLVLLRIIILLAVAA